MTLPDRVLSMVHLQYPEEKHREVEEMLCSYGTEPHEHELERVLCDVLALADGDLEELKYYLRCAKLDYRDVLLWAEWPEESRLVTREQIDEVHRQLARAIARLQGSKSGQDP